VAKGRSAFTLIELLVVITIIGILIGLLFPVYATVMRSVQEYTCQNNLAQLAKVMAAYCQQNDGYFPFVGYKTTVQPSGEDWLYVADRQTKRPLSSKTTPPVGDMERGALMKCKLVGKLDIFYCPTDLDQGLVRGPVSSQYPSGTKAGTCLRYTIVGPNITQPATSYVINGSVTFGDQYVGGTGVRRVRRFSEFSPSAFLFIEESNGDTNAGELASNANSALMNPNDTTRKLTSCHRWGGYIACMDGRVEWIHSGNTKDPNFRATDNSDFEYTRKWASGDSKWYEKSSHTTAGYAMHVKRWNP
jgi:prepilin-type N-terminal cleavage/methylation domain-containing protein